MVELVESPNLMKYLQDLLIQSILTAVLCLPAISLAQESKSKDPIRVGWIGGMTGPSAKWGAYQAAMLGLEDVNSATA